MKQEFRAPFGITLLIVVSLLASCQGSDATRATAVLPALTQDSVAHVVLNLPAGGAMTIGTPERLTIDAVNVKPGCAIAGPAWLGLVGPDLSGGWTVTPTIPGSVDVHALCQDFRGALIDVPGTIIIYPTPAVLPDISGPVPVAQSDSVDVRYDSTAAQSVTVSCVNCGTAASIARIAGNAIRFYARQYMADTVKRSVCFVAHGLDGRATQQVCVVTTLRPKAGPLLSIPDAVRHAEVVSLHATPVATYDNTGESTHPDMLRVPAAWAMGSCMMVFTPYAGSNGLLENPSLAVSPDCEHWVPAPGVKAPLIDRPANGYNSDPDFMYDARTGCLGVMYREVMSTNNINLSTSCDGTTWTAPRQLFAAPNHQAVSPTSTVGPDGRQRIWVVDAGSAGCSATSTTVRMRVATSDTLSLAGMTFADPVPVDLAQPGYVIWHIKVRYIPEKHEDWALHAAFPHTTGIGDCTDDDVFFATSSDGSHWRSYPVPLLNHLDARFNYTTLYRGTFLYDAQRDELQTVVSAIESGKWGQFGVVHKYSTLSNALNMSWTASAASLTPSAALVRRPDPNRKRLVIEDHP